METKLIEITEMHDECDCETCGTSYATGYLVKIDGEEFMDFTPLASCYDGVSFDLEYVYAQILQHLGHTVKLNAN